MKNYILIVSITGLFLLTFSCKKNSVDNKPTTDTLSSVTTQPTIPEKSTPINVVQSDFKKIQNLPELSSDTIYVTNYWATWCPPCVEEIPAFVQLQNEYKNKSVKFTFVSVDNSSTLQSDVIPFIKKNKMENVYMIPIAELHNFQSFNPELTQGIPVTIIQKKKNKEGFIGGLSKEFLTQKIEEYLTKK